MKTPTKAAGSTLFFHSMARTGEATFLTAFDVDDTGLPSIRRDYIARRGSATPIRQSRVTQAANSVSLIASVPSGRMGMTI